MRAKRYKAACKRRARERKTLGLPTHKELREQEKERALAESWRNIFVQRGVLSER